MSFFDSFLRGVAEAKQTRENREISEMCNDLYEDDKDYRKTALANTDSNHGWYTCPRCGRKFRKSQMQADHIVPKSCGGDNSRYNLQLLCAHCNQSKSNNMKDTARDLERRRKELEKQDKEDVEIMNIASKILKGR